VRVRKLNRKEVLIEKNREYPWFTLDEYIRDGNGNRPDHPDFNPKTLFIPEEEWKGFSPGMKRYREIKSQYFDKVIFYRFGDWYVIYYQDLDICS